MFVKGGLSTALFCRGFRTERKLNRVTDLILSAGTPGRSEIAEG